MDAPGDDRARWNVPGTEEGLKTALARLAECRAAGARSSEGTLYGSLAKIAAAKGETEEATKFRDRQRELQEDDGLIPKNRRFRPRDGQATDRDGRSLGTGADGGGFPRRAPSA